MAKTQKKPVQPAVAAKPAPTAPPPAPPGASKGSATTGFRVEKDSMGEVKVPSERMWGAQTQRALENFTVSGRTMRPLFLA